MSGCALTAPSKTADGPSPVIATYGDRVIRQGEVDAKVKDELLKLEEQIFELRSEAAAQLAVEALVAQQAKAAKQSEDEWLSLNVEAGVPEPTEEQLEGLYNKARGRIPAGVTYEDVKPQLVQAVKRELRGKRAREVFSKLKAEANYTLLLKGPDRPRRAVEAVGPSRGPKDAKVTIVVFADFECPYCAKANESLREVMEAYGDKVRLVFRHYPLSFHPLAARAAAAGVCADEQGKFWELHDALFDSQEVDESALRMHAASLGLDEAKFSDCLTSERAQATVKRDMAAGQAAGVNGTPAFFINGIELTGARPPEDFARIIEAELTK